MTTGASAAVVAATALLGTGVVQQVGYIAFAVPGAVVAVIVVIALGSRSRSDTLVPLVLAGAVVTAVLHALITAVVLSMPAVFDSYRFWVVGSLTGADLDDLWTAGPVALVGLIAAFALTGGLNALGLGDEMAASLGVRVPLVRAAGILAATLLAAAATALTGPIAFLGLAVPHIARAAVGHDLRWQLPACVFAGAGPCSSRQTCSRASSSARRSSWSASSRRCSAHRCCSPPSAGTTTLRDESSRLAAALMGSLGSRTLEHVALVGGAILLCVPFLVACGHRLQALELGDGLSAALGTPPGRTRAGAIVLSVVRLAAAVAVAGPVAFVALTAANAAPRLSGSTGPNLVGSARTGAVVLVGADLISQNVPGLDGLPVGVVTGLVGGVYLGFLLVGAWKKAGA